MHFVLASVVLGVGFSFYSGAVEAWLVDALEASGFDEQLDNVFPRGAIVSGVAQIGGSIGGGLLASVDLSQPYFFRGRATGRRLRRRVVHHARRRLRAARFLELLGRDTVWIAGLIAALVASATIAGNEVVSFLTRFCGRRTTLLVASTAVLSVAAIGVGVVDSFWAALPLFLVAMGATGVGAPVQQAYLHAVIPSAERATVVSSYRSSAAPARSVAPSGSDISPTHARSRPGTSSAASPPWWPCRRCSRSGAATSARRRHRRAEGRREVALRRSGPANGVITRHDRPATGGGQPLRHPAGRGRVRVRLAVVQTSFSDWAWFDHLTDDDWRVIGRIAPQAGSDPASLCGDVDALTRLLAHPAAFESVFGHPSEHAVLAVSPFLTFALIVHRAWDELQHVGHVDEWVGLRQRLPVLGGHDLRDFLASPLRRLFLTELLASYTRVSSGAMWIHTRRGWRRRRFSELDPARLASLLEVVPDEERPGVYRRLGDLSLFLTGVFPDHTELHGLAPLDVARLVRLGGLPVDDSVARAGAVTLLERLGQRWYGLASRTANPRTGAIEVVADIGNRFAAARRTLNLVTDRHLFARRSDWFGEPA